MSIVTSKKRFSRDASLRKQMIELLPRLRRFARSLARDSDMADDLVQAACERALGRLNQFEDDLRLDSWMFRIIYTRWIDRLRRRKTRSDYLAMGSQEVDFPVAPAQVSERLEATIDISRALGTLPPENRAAISLICIEGYSYLEAANILDIPQGTVASRVARARRLLSRMLTREERPVTVVPIVIKKERWK